MESKLQASQRIIHKVNKELKRYLPTGASKNKKHCDLKIKKRVFVIDSRRYIIDNSYKPRSPRITKKFEEMFSSGQVLSKSPIQTLTRTAFSPVLAKFKSTSPEVAKRLMRMCSNDTTGIELVTSIYEKEKKNQVKLEKVNGILEACQEAKKESTFVKSKIRDYTRKVKTYANEVKDVLGISPELILDYGKRTDRERELRESKAQELALKLIYNKVGETMIKRAVSTEEIKDIDLISFSDTKMSKRY